MGVIISLTPNLQPFVDLLRLVHPAIDQATVRAVLQSWGPGKFDAELLMDGKAFRPDGHPAVTLIPPAFGLAGVNPTRGLAGARSRIGMASSQTWKCKGGARSSTPG